MILLRIGELKGRFRGERNLGKKLLDGAIRDQKNEIAQGGSRERFQRRIKGGEKHRVKTRAARSFCRDPIGARDGSGKMMGKKTGL